MFTTLPHLCTFDSIRSAPDLDLLRLFLFDRAAKTYNLHTGHWRSILSTPPESTFHRRLIAGVEIARRAAYEEFLNKSVALTNCELVRDYLLRHFLGCSEERFVSLWLDSQHRVLAVDELFRGTLSQTSVYPREVVKVALARNAAAVIFAHNHPSGSVEPSQADRQLTTQLKDVLALVEVRVLDHFIVSGQQTVSMATLGHL